MDNSKVRPGVAERREAALAPVIEASRAGASREEQDQLASEALDQLLAGVPVEEMAVGGAGGEGGPDGDDEPDMDQDDGADDYDGDDED